MKETKYRRLIWRPKLRFVICFGLSVTSYKKLYSLVEKILFPTRLTWIRFSAWLNTDKVRCICHDGNILTRRRRPSPPSLPLCPLWKVVILRESEACPTHCGCALHQPPLWKRFQKIDFMTWFRSLSVSQKYEYFMVNVWVMWFGSWFNDQLTVDSH